MTATLDKPSYWLEIEFGALGDFFNGKTPSSDNLTIKGKFPYFKVAEMNILGNEKYLTNTSLYLVDGYSGPIYERGSFVFPKNGGAVLTNKKRILKFDSVVDLNTGVFTPYTFLDTDYLFYYFSTFDFSSRQSGSVIPTINMTELKKRMVPIPPLEEQKRIVAKIEELFAKIDEIDKAQKELKELAELAEKKVLDMAVRGELSSSLSSDSKAEDLLKQINVNKSVLIAQKKLRNEKELPYVSKLEKYIELPPHWVWTRLGSISYGLNYGTSNKSKSCGKVAVLRMGNLQNGEIDYSDLVFTENEEDIEKYQLLQNDLLFNRTNSAKHVGKTAIYRGEVPAIFAGYLIRIRTDMNQDYLNIVMNSSYEKNYCQSVKTDAVNQSNVNAQKLASFPIPVPPIEEQSRIATTVSLFRAQFSTINS